MEYLNDLYEMCEILSRELGEANDKIREAGGKLTVGDLEYVDKLTHAIKSVKTTIAMIESEDEESGMYMPYGRSYARGDGNRGSRNENMGRTYRDGSSYARRRDSRGRYSSRRGSSYDNGMIEELRDLMEQAPDESTKKEFHKLITKLESI